MSLSLLTGPYAARHFDPARQPDLVGGRCYELLMGENVGVGACRECQAGRPHCHGTLIHHRGQKAHCTDPDCSHPEVLLHSLAVDCEAIGCPCGEDWDHQLAI